MSISVSYRQNIFGLLDKWSKLNPAALEREASEENLRIIQDLVAELSEDLAETCIKTPHQFCTVVYQLGELKKLWSRKLGDAILVASDTAEVSGMEPALFILQEFSSKCPSRFYRDIAEREMESIKRKFK